MLISSLVITNTTQRARKKAKRKFLYYFPKGYQGQKYIDWERQYKFDAHTKFQQELNKHVYEKLLEAKKYEEIAAIAARIESKTNLLFSFEKMHCVTR
ncbi:MAG TPA: hypothetical protein VK489_10295 [Ferruginibacter sp.]|nr:hypothetical protein [Ferruginibacter sp.]